MSDANSPPTRLLDDPQLAASLRGDLQLASSHAPVAYDVGAGLSRFEQAVLSPTAGLSATKGSGAALRVVGWCIGAAVLIGGSVQATWMMSADEVERVDHVDQGLVADASPQPVQAEDEPVAGPRSSDATEIPAGSRTSESVAEAGPGSEAEAVGADAGAGSTHQAEGGSPTVHGTAPVQPASDPPAKPDAPSLADEAAQINAARKALTKDPAKTLALMEAAEQQFPDGAMVQERRGYAILALVALDRVADAEQRADAYLQRWPKGSLSRRIRDALGR